MLLAFEDPSHILADFYPVAPQGACFISMREGYPFGWMSKQGQIRDASQKRLPQGKGLGPGVIVPGSLDTWMRCTPTRPQSD